MAAINDPKLVTLLSDAFDKLQKALLSLKNLPLSIVGVKCTSGYYRRTKAYPYNGITVKYTDNDNVVGEVAQATASGRFSSLLPSIKVLISLERGGKWGDDLAVIAKLKSVFYVDLSRRMKAACRWFSVPTEAELYVIVDRIVFSLRIVHQKEIALLSQAETALSSTKSIEQKLRPNSAAFLLRKKLIHKPMLSQQLYGLSQRCPAFAQTCIYVRQWLGWNFLSKMFEGMAVELIVANLFLHDKSVPTSGVAGFCRFIALLATFDFKSKPLIVDVNNNLAYDSRVEAKENFVQCRSTLPPLVIITPEDPEGTIFTATKPEPFVFLRTVKLAKAMHEQICASALQNRIYSKFELPTHDTKIYDFLIRLRPRHTAIADVTNRKKGVHAFKAIRPAAPYLPVVDLEPAKLLVEDFSNNFGSVAMFFFNAYKPYAIGVALRPDFMFRKSANTVYGCHGSLRPGDQLDLKALLQDFRIFGGPMIRDIIVSPQHRKSCGVNFEETVGKTETMIEDLVAGMEGAFAVSENNIHDEHPHFSDYKNEGKISEGQRARREQFIQRQAQARDSIRDRIRFMYDKYYEAKSDDAADESMDSALTADDTRHNSETPSIVSGHGGVDKKISTDLKFLGEVTDGFEGMDFSKWGLPKKKGKKTTKSQHSSQDAAPIPAQQNAAKNGTVAGISASRRAQQHTQKQQQQLQASYSDTLMFSEWLVDIPPAACFDTEWVMLPCPVGKRCLVVAYNGYTSVYNKTGYRLAHFQTDFVGGSRASPDSYTLLDCILGKGEKKYYVLDVISWAGEQFSDKEFVVRHAFLQAKFDEMPQLSDPGPEGPPTKFTFHCLPLCQCTRKAMKAFMQTDFQYPLDGLLFYYSKVYYTPGQTPLVGWLKPWMLPEILDVEIPMKFICEQGFYTSSKHFIDRFNEKHRFRSSIAKPNDADNGQPSEAANDAAGGMDVVADIGCPQ